MSASATRSKELLLDTLSGFECADGRSDDPYCREITYHPMAEAKYLWALSELLDTKLVSRSRYSAAVERSVARLADADVLRTGRYAAWGLGFSWGSADEDLPFVITTSMIVRALATCSPRLDGRGASHAARLAQRGRQWLLEDVEMNQTTHGPSGGLPVYSAVHREVVYNAVASWLAAVKSELPDVRRSQTLAYILQRRSRPRGWVYGPGSTRIDLLHQGYIVNSLLEVGEVLEVENAALELIGGFRTHHQILDKVDAVGRADALAAAQRAGSVRIEVHGDQAAVLHAASATRWSVGELTAMVAALSHRGREHGYWSSVCRRLMPELIHSFESHDDQPGWRPLLHLAHGAAAALAVLRSG